MPIGGPSPPPGSAGGAAVKRRARTAAGTVRAERLAPYVLVAPAVLIIVALRLWPLALGGQLLLHGRWRVQRNLRRGGQLPGAG
ncbi:hypothetical protein ACFSTC_32365 [Nonomuraea ferruginea]